MKALLEVLVHVIVVAVLFVISDLHVACITEMVPIHTRLMDGKMEMLSG